MRARGRSAVRQRHPRVHSCTHWLGTELCEIELGGEILEDEVALVASEGRLLRRVDASDETMRGRFAEICLERARDLADGCHVAASIARRPRRRQLGSRRSKR